MRDADSSLQDRSSSRSPVTTSRRLLLGCVFTLAAGSFTAGAARAEGNYDPFSSKDPQERAHAEQMRVAIEKGDWQGAAAFATTPALKRLYKEAQVEFSKSAPPPKK